MPSTQEMLDALANLAGRLWPIAFAFHVAIALGAGALALGLYRPSRRGVAFACAAPLVSVSACALAGGNAVNGVVFAATAVALTHLADRVPEGQAPARTGPTWAASIGAASLALGLFYPHFLAGRPAYVYVFAAPFAVLPCPTLLAVVGATLLAGGLSRAFSMVVGGLGAVYGLVGALALGVRLDLALFGASIAAIVLAAAPSPGRAAATARHRLRRA
ncbi:MAG TPA: hypothetical protein VHB21_08790 [Minicystis sp.]|nr:hypothetical protein [Minicystis sp.]